MLRNKPVMVEYYVPMIPSKIVDTANVETYQTENDDEKRIKKNAAVLKLSNGVDTKITQLCSMSHYCFDLLNKTVFVTHTEYNK